MKNNFERLISESCFTGFRKDIVHIAKLIFQYFNFNINVNQSNPQDQKLVYEFGNEMNSDINWVGRKIRSDKSFAKLLESPGF